MKACICILAFIINVQADLLAHHSSDDHSDVHHSDRVQLGHSSAIVIDGIDDHHHHDSNAHYQTHPAFHQLNSDLHHNVHHDNVHHDNVHHDILDIHHAPGTEIIHHEPVHHIEPAHVTKIVHHEPHHYLHYHHIDEHHHAAHGQANIRHVDLHHHDVTHHANVALLRQVSHFNHPYDYHKNSAIVHYAHPTHFNSHSPAYLLSFAKHQLNGHYGKVKITEKHY